MGNRRFDGTHCILFARHRAKIHARQNGRNGGELMDKIINVSLLAHPMNWLTVLLMLTIAAIAGHEILSLVKLEPATNN